VKSINSRIFRFLVLTASLVVLVEASTLSTDRALALTPANVPCGLVGWWPLDGNATDIKNGNNGVVTGGAFVNAMVNQGWQSAGPTSVISVPDAPALHVSTLTIDFWIKLTSTTQLNTVAIWKGNVLGTTVTSPYSVGIRGSSGGNSFGGAARMVIFSIGNQATVQYLQSTSSLPLNTFKHVTVTADGVKLKIYIDGVPNGSASQTVFPGPGTRPLQIGGISGAATNANSLNGVIDEVELFNRALDPIPKSEIMAIVQAGSLGKCKS
jgi:Concanavalin A-like lectin/glucanases superfamily